MSLPRYPRYKDSGVEGLGGAPEHWEVAPLKRNIARVESGTSVNSSDQPATDGRAGVLKTSCVYGGFFDPSENKLVTDEDLHRVSCPVRQDTLIVSRMNTPDLVGAAGVVREAPTNLFLPDRLWQVSFVNATASFMHFWTLTSIYRAHVEAACTGTSSSMKNLGQDQFGQFPVAFPPLIEQGAIAAFLDRETAKIDALVAEQERLIELLKEKRQAVISHAVTKGLKPDVAMKGSGVEWLGEIPAHWQTPKLFHALLEPPKNGVSPDVAPHGTTPTFSIAAVRDGVVDIQKHVKYAAIGLSEAQPYLVAQHDVLLLRGSGSKALVGTAGMVMTVPPANCIYPDILIRLRPSRCLSASYLVASLNSSAIRPQLEAAAQTSAGIWKIAGGSVRELRLPIPPISEQREIERFVAREASRFGAAVEEAQRAIDLLQERRTALISAAVTGQIDVRKVAGVAAAHVAATT